MVDIQSKEVIDKVSDELKIQPAGAIPRAISDRIMLNYNVNPAIRMQVLKADVSDSTGGTIFTTSTTKRTFMIGAEMAISKDVVNDSTLSDIRMTPLGKAAASFLTLKYEPTTAGQLIESVILPYGIELEPGSTISTRNGSATASIDVTGTVYFYETDPQ